MKSTLTEPFGSGLPDVTSTDGVVNIVDPGQTGQPLQPTPTANPGLKTPTSLPTPETDPLILPSQGSTDNPTGGNPTGNTAPGSGAGSGNAANGSGSLAGTSPSGVQLPPNSAVSAASGAANQNFPHAGTGPEGAGRDVRWNYGIAILFFAGAALLLTGRRKRVAQRVRSGP